MDNYIQIYTKLDKWNLMINGMFELNKKNNMSKKYKIFCYPADITMQGYFDMYDTKEIDIPTVCMEQKTSK